MKASLDTNAIIHFYKAGLQDILFSFFQDGVIIYEQIRNIELENHGQDVLNQVDEDIAKGRIQLYTDDLLKEQAVFTMFQNNVKENRLLYQPGDLGEVYAISLAQTIGAYSLVTDDTKPGGPYASLLRLNYDIMPFNFADVLIVRYLIGTVDAKQTIDDFENINNKSSLNWSFKVQVKKFINRFIRDPYKIEDKEWMNNLVAEHKVKLKTKFSELNKYL